MSRISDFSQGLPQVIRHPYGNQVFVSPQTSPAKLGAKVWVALGKSCHLCRPKKRQKFETAAGKENFQTETEGRSSGRKLSVT